jgi:hypothetical protein
MAIDGMGNIVHVAAIKVINLNYFHAVVKVILLSIFASENSSNFAIVLSRNSELYMAFPPPLASYQPWL